MQRYAKYWSGLIVFLLHAIAEDNEGPFPRVIGKRTLDSKKWFKELIVG